MQSVALVSHPHPDHMDGFGRGFIDTKDVVYFVSAIAIALFPTLRSLESKRWRG